MDKKQELLEQEEVCLHRMEAYLRRLKLLKEPHPSLTDFLLALINHLLFGGPTPSIFSPERRMLYRCFDSAHAQFKVIHQQLVSLLDSEEEG